MKDFREELYRNYVTNFKLKIGSYDLSEVNKFWKWSDYKYAPLLEKYNKDSRILEIGCGPGFFLQYLAQKGFTNAEGVDLAEEQVSIAAANGVSAVSGDAFQFLATNASSYDIIIAFDLLEHFTRDELLTLSSLVFNALRPGGMFLIHTPNADGFMAGKGLFGDLTHMTLLNQNSLTQLFTFAGFSKIDFIESGPAPVNVKSTVRLILWRILSLLLRGLKTIESGSSSKILTQNIIAAAYKSG